MPNQPAHDRPPMRALRGVPDDLWDALKVAAEGDRSALLHAYIRHATGTTRPDDLLPVGPAPRDPLPPGPLLDTPAPGEDTTEAGSAMLRGLHAHITGLLPPPTWDAAAVLDSLEQRGQTRVPPGYYLGLSTGPGPGGFLEYGVWPDPA